MRAIEVDRRGRPDHDVDRAGVDLRPAAGGDRLAHDLLFRVGQDVGDVELAGHLDVHAGGDIRLRVEIDHEGADTSGEGGGGKPQRDSGLADTTLERAHRQYVHEALRYRPLGWVHTQAGPVTNSEV